MRACRVLLSATLVVCVGCSTPQRSRETANPGTSAETLALQVCSNCHGVDGNSVSPNFPNLAAQQETYLIAQLNGFKNHHRSDPAGYEYMWGLSRHLTDDQIRALAAYYARQKPRPGRPGESALAFEGEGIFYKGIPERNIPPCTTCHGDKGQGNAQFPRLADQHGDYLVKQLEVFQRTDQRPEGSVMKGIAHGLTRAHMEAVAAFLQAFPTGQ